MIIIPPGQEVLLEIDDAKFWITPLTSGQRNEITHFITNKAGEQVVDTDRQSRLALKYGLKRAKGIYLPDGTEFKLDFSEGFLSEKHCNILIESSVLVHLMALKLSQGSVPMSEGIKVTMPGSKKKKRKKGSATS